MGNKAKGIRSKTRDKYSKSTKKITVNKLLEEFPKNSKVIIKTNPSIHSAIPFRRFHGKIGTVLGKQGTIFKVQIKDGNKEKQVLVAAAHLHSLTSNKKEVKQPEQIEVAKPEESIMGTSKATQLEVKE